MSITASVSQIFAASESGTDELAAVSVSTEARQVASSTTADLIWSYTSTANETATKNFDLTALTGDDRGTIQFTEVYGIIIVNRSGTTVQLVDPASVTANLYDEQGCLEGGVGTLSAGDFSVQASSTTLGTVSATSKILEYTLVDAQIDLVVWGEGVIS